MTSLVYAITTRDTDGPVKIGTTRFIDFRLKQLMTWSPYPLQVLWSAPGGPSVERQLHNRLSASWSHNEWFLLTDDVMHVVGRLIDGESVASVVSGHVGETIFARRQRAKRGVAA